MFSKVIGIRLITLFLIFFSQSAMCVRLIEIEPNNPPPGTLIETAFNIDAFFSSEFNANIGDIAGNNISEDSLHVSIIGSGEGTFDYFSFNVNQTDTMGIFDIDFGATQNTSNTNTKIALWDESGSVLSFNDNFNITAGANGSSSEFDSFIQYTFTTTGRFIVGVAKSDATADTNGWIGNALEAVDSYTLNIALGTGFAQTPVPLPPSIILFLSGIFSIFGFNQVSRKLRS